MSASMSTLDQRLYLPWRPEFRLGAGFDWVTASKSESALAKVTPEKPPIPAGPTSSQIHWVRNESEYQQTIKASLSGSGTIEGVKIGASTRLANSLTYSNTAMTLLISWVSAPTQFLELTGRTLSPAARALVGDPHRFRLTYGDYFVNGALAGASFHAVYRMRAESSSSLMQFAAKVTASVEEMFEAKASTAFSQLAKDNNITVDIDIEHTGMSAPEPPKSGKGGKGLSFSPTDVAAYFEAFKSSHSRDNYLVAELVHYSAIEHSLSREIAVPPEHFGNLAVVMSKMGAIRTAMDSLPPLYQREHEDEATRLLEGWKHARFNALDRPEQVMAYLTSSTVLADTIQPIGDFFAQLAYKDGGTGALADTGGRNGFTRGVAPESAPDSVPVFVRSDLVEGDAEFLTNITRRLDFTIPGCRLINVRAYSFWDHDTRGEVIGSGGGVNRENLHLGWESDNWRGLSWRVDTAFVPHDVGSEETARRSYEPYAHPSFGPQMLDEALDITLPQLDETPTGPLLEAVAAGNGVDDDAHTEDSHAGFGAGGDWTLTVVNRTDQDPKYPGMRVKVSTGTKKGTLAPGQQVQFTGNRQGSREVHAETDRVGVRPATAYINPGSDFRTFTCHVGQNGTELIIRVINR